MNRLVAVKLLVLGILLWGFSVSAHAQGFYIGASYLGAETEWMGEREYDAGLEARLGYSFNSLLAIEATYLDLGTVTLPDFVDAGGSADTDAYSLAAVATIPLGNLNFFGKAGYLRTETDGVFGTIAGPRQSNIKQDEMFIGGGIGFEIFDTFELRLELNKSDDFDWAGVGVNLRF